MTAAYRASDATYHHRHARRSLARAASIAAHIDGPASVLDVGCNIGFTSRYLLDQGVADRVCGIELHAETVDPALREDPRFELITGDVTRVIPARRFDAVIYGAVHHHVLNHQGLGAAVSALQRLADCARQSLFFETGHLTEGGRWDWQRRLRDYFSSDEEHLHYLLACIEHRITGFELIGRFRIHGVRRCLLRIDLAPDGAEAADEVARLPVAMPTGEAGFRYRSFGSSAQRLLPAEAPAAGDAPVRFARLDDPEHGPLFLKQYLHHPRAAGVEAAIGGACTLPGAVNCLGYTADGGALLFPRIDGARDLDAIARADRAERCRAADQLIAFFAAAADTRHGPIRRPLLPVAGQLPLIELCDFNRNNLLFQGRDAELQLRVVDFEQHAVANGWRNRLHLAAALRRLRVRPVAALAAALRGWAGLLRFLLLPPRRPVAERIRDRRPAWYTLLLIAVRSRTGALLAAVLGRFGLS